MRWCSVQTLGNVGAIVVLAGIAVQPNLAQADPVTTSQSINCQNASATPELNECARREYEAADKRLNRLYQQLTKRLQGSPKKEQLVDAQLAWIKFRDTACAYERWDGGTGSYYSYTFCQARITRQRITDLEDYLRR